MERPDKPVLLTGASGMLGRVLVKALGEQGWSLRLTDLAPFPDRVPDGAEFHQVDLCDGPAILRLAEGCGTILHFGGISVEHPFETVIGPNIRGLYHIYEAARREKARMVFASSNHVVGFHERDETLDDDCSFRVDGYYGLSKAYGELMGQLYWDKHGVDSVFLRIGSCRAEPTDARMLSTWLSFGDLTRLVIRGTLAKTSGCVVIWGASNNRRMTWWRNDAREAIGWRPQDSADAFENRLLGMTSGHPVAERYQGGPFCVLDYSRDRLAETDKS
ncbi:MAG TPA: NAD(P)-dependent oxidoreductase [Alphaproteobacteria bacterium]|nr:NAD(P)-dependent oxidoreductase [Alphaproteobacteria bacterium]